MHILNGFIKDKGLKVDPITKKVIHPEGRKYVVYEGTSGNTGISLGLLGSCLGFQAHIYLNDDLSSEKVRLVEPVRLYDCVRL